MATETVIAATDRLAVLFEEHHARLYRLGLRLVSDPEEARDLLQETFLRAARQRRLPPDSAAASTWLTRTLINLSRDHFRHRAVHSRALPDLVDTEATERSPEGPLAAKSVVKAALETLPHRKRVIVVLHELEELTVAEIARTLGLRQATVRWHLAGSKKRLARFLEPAALQQQELRSNP